MKLSIYVHEFHLQVGHSRAMIELLCSLSKEEKKKITSIEVVAYECSDLGVIFKEFQCEKKVTIIPLGWLKPFLLKALFYNTVTLFHTLFLASKRIKIGIGIACWNVDIVNVQFIHKQWDHLYFQTSPMGALKKIYKKMLFSFFSFGENFVYTRKKTQFIAIAQFIKQGLMDSFKTRGEAITLIPSGVNLNEFNFSDKPREELVSYLKSKYPVLSSLDLNKPIVLFVGAYERKGLDRALEALASRRDYQFIVIGKPEQSSNINLKDNSAHFFITFTKEVNLFYELSDIFIFPTRYEPFGLVIIEAYIMGLDIIVPKENVGASEIIPESEGVYFFHQHEKLEISRMEKIPLEMKKQRRREREKNIENYNWMRAGEKFQTLLAKDS